MARTNKTAPPDPGFDVPVIAQPNGASGARIETLNPPPIASAPKAPPPSPASGPTPKPPHNFPVVVPSGEAVLRMQALQNQRAREDRLKKLSRQYPEIRDLIAEHESLLGEVALLKTQLNLLNQ